MPCYEIRTCTVEFRVGNIDLLKKALEKEWTVVQGGIKGFLIATKKNFYGGKISINLNTSKIQSQFYSEKDLLGISNQIKRAYSECVIDEVAKKQKWIKKQLSPNQFQLQRF